LPRAGDAEFLSRFGYSSCVSLSNSKTRKTALGCVGVLFGVAAIYHLAVILLPSIDQGSSPERHAVFIAINVAVAVGLFVRPRFFFWLFTALGLQQLHSHGSTLVREWFVAHRLDWQSVLVLVIIPLTWWLLLAEYRVSRRDRVR